VRRRIAAIAGLAAALALTACGDDPAPRARQGEAAPVRTLQPLRAPSGWRDLSDDPPEHIRKLAEQEGGELLHFFLDGVRLKRPIAIQVARSRTPRLVPVSVVAAKRVAGIRQALAKFDPQVSSVRDRTLKGVPAATYDVQYAFGPAEIHQRFVDVKQPGGFDTYTVMLTAPTGASFQNALPAFERVQDAWTWSNG
jgi:hypothetical protein